MDKGTIEERDREPQEAIVAPLMVHSVSPTTPPKPLYFAVSTTKLAVMFFCTMGIYGTYWFYKNWALIKDRERSNISPVWRSLLEFLYCYSCFVKIRDTAKENGLEVSLSVGSLTAGFILFGLLGAAPDPCWLLASLAGFFLVPVQKVANRINTKLAPDHDANSHFSGSNIAIIAVGGLLSAASIGRIFWSGN